MNPLSFFNMPKWQAYCQNIFHLSSFSQQVDCLRLDQIHPVLSGNKPLKLLGWLEHFQQSGYTSLLSFGGPYSNHLHALAYLGQCLNIPTVLVVRGYAQQPLTPTLQDCQNWGATLVFADKKSYSKRYQPDYQQALAVQYHALVIGEGGSASAEKQGLGERGCESLADLAQHYQQVWLAVGSGTTALGLAQGLVKRAASTQLLGVNVVADQGERYRHWQQHMPKPLSWRLLEDAHCGGFAKVTPELLDLIERYQGWNLPLEPIYSAKLLLAFERQQQQNKAAKVLLVHGGGLQGRRGFASLFNPAVL